MLILLARRLTLALLLLVTASAVGCKKKKADPAGDEQSNAPPPGARPGMPTPGAPSGLAKDDGAVAWSEVVDSIGGFRVSVPGTNRAQNMATAPEPLKKRQTIMYAHAVGSNTKAATLHTHSFVPLHGAKLGSSPDDLYAGLLAHQDGTLAFSDILSKDTITLGGKPGLKVVSKANNFSPPPKVEDPEFAARLEAGYKKDIARRWTHLVTTTPTRVIVVMIQTEGDPDPAETKRIIDSFAFL